MLIIFVLFFLKFNVFYSYDSFMNEINGNKDSSLDCQPIIYQRCSADEVRNEQGACINANVADTDCNNYCHTTRTLHYSNVFSMDSMNDSIDASVDASIEYGRLSRETGHCSCYHDTKYGSSVVSMLQDLNGNVKSIAAYIDGANDYIIRDVLSGTEISRVKAKTSQDTSLYSRFGSCPRATKGGEECKIVLMHTNTHGLNMAVLGSVLDGTRQTTDLINTPEQTRRHLGALHNSEDNGTFNIEKLKI